MPDLDPTSPAAAWRDRFSLHQGSVLPWSLADLERACTAHGVRRVSLLAPRTRALGVEATRAVLDGAGLTATSYSAAGFMAGDVDPDGNPWTLDDSLRVLDEAVVLGAGLVVVVSGPLPSGLPLERAWANVERGLEALVPAAAERGLRLAFEPAHPMFCPDRSVVCTLDHAAALVAGFPDTLGLDVDLYHVWWDPHLARDLRRWADRILTVQLSDWLHPLPDRVLGRGVMGEGWVDVRSFVALAEDIGYAAPYEVEVLNAEVGAMPPEQGLARLLDAYTALLGPAGPR